MTQSFWADQPTQTSESSRGVGRLTQSFPSGDSTSFSKWRCISIYSLQFPTHTHIRAKTESLSRNGCQTHSEIWGFFPGSAKQWFYNSLLCLQQIITTSKDPRFRNCLFCKSTRLIEISYVIFIKLRFSMLYFWGEKRKNWHLHLNRSGVGLGKSKVEP